MESSANIRAPRGRLERWIEALQGKGRYVFRREEACAAIAYSAVAFQAAARRLIKKGRLIMPRRGFFVLVPFEYQSAGAPPPSWFIEDLMAHARRPYYVGLLSAAALHGAAQQQPQEFQVVTDVPIRPIRVGRAVLRFFTKRHFGGSPTQSVKTETGSMRVSSPEVTALDLVRYVGQAGQLNNVATVLRDLAERLDPRRLVEAARTEVELSHVQRLGLLLDRVAEARRTDALARWVRDQRPRVVSLRPDRPSDGAAKDARWSVLVNESVEPDE